jgi:hypothetical protein
MCRSSEKNLAFRPGTTGGIFSKAMSGSPPALDAEGVPLFAVYIECRSRSTVNENVVVAVALWWWRSTAGSLWEVCHRRYCPLPLATVRCLIRHTLLNIRIPGKFSNSTFLKTKLRTKKCHSFFPKNFYFFFFLIVACILYNVHIFYICRYVGVFLHMFTYNIFIFHTEYLHMSTFSDKIIYDQ